MITKSKLMTILIFLLILNLGFFIFNNTASVNAKPKYSYEYKVIKTTALKLQKALNQSVKQGWELVDVKVMFKGNSSIQDMTAIFKKKI